MRLKGICRQRRSVLGLLGLVLSGIIIAKPDIGGGGRVRTPYKSDLPVTEGEIAKVKKYASQTRVLNDQSVTGTHIPGGGRDVGLMYLRNEAPIGSAIFKFQGTDESGLQVAVDFSEVESFRLIKHGDHGTSTDRELVEVTQFPAISPAALLQKNPSYSELKAQYTKTVRVWLAAKRSGGRRLCLVARDQSGRYKAVAPLSDLPLNSKVVLEYGLFQWKQISLPAIWWAIDSVVKDEKYPYRVIVRS